MRSAQKSCCATALSVLLVSIASVLICVLFGAGSSSPEQENKIEIATGPQKGNYHNLGRALADRAARHQLQLEPILTKGSVQNLHMLRCGDVQYAFVQSDLVKEAILGHRPFGSTETNCDTHNSETSYEDMRVVAPLLHEIVHVLVRAHVYAATVEELRNKTVSVGPEGSGIRPNARAVLEAAGISMKEIDPRGLDPNQIESALEAEDIDAAFLTTALPAQPVEEALRKGEARLVPLTYKTVERLVRIGGYVQSSIPKNIYTSQTSEVPTIAVDALLITNRKDSHASAHVRELIDILKDERKPVEAASGLQLLPLNRKEIDRLSLPIDEDAQEYLPGPRAPWGWLLLSVGVLAAGFVTYLNKKWIATAGILLHVPLPGALRRSVYLVRLGSWMAKHARAILVCIVLSLTWLLSALGLYYFEHNINDNFDSVPKTAWSILVYFAGAFQTRVPMTPGGDVVAVFTLLFGVAIVSWFTSELAGGFVKREFRPVFELLRGSRLKKHMTDHIVIVNGDHRVLDLVRQLHGTNFRDKKPIVVLTEKEIRFPDEDEFEGVSQVVGYATHSSDLNRACVLNAHSVVILSPLDEATGHSDENADCKTIMTISAIRELRAENGRPVPITAEIKLRRFCEPAERAGASGAGQINILCLDEFGADILAQCAYTPGISNVYCQLLTFSKDHSEIYKTEAPSECYEKTFADVMHYYAELQRDRNVAVLPIGIIRPPLVYVNPHRGSNDPGILKRGDYLIVIADNQETANTKSKATTTKQASSSF